jgi:hypothetical protein
MKEHVLTSYLPDNSLAHERTCFVKLHDVCILLRIFAYHKIDIKIFLSICITILSQERLCSFLVSKLVHVFRQAKVLN